LTAGSELQSIRDRETSMADEATIEARFAALAAALTEIDGVTLGGRGGFGSGALQVDGRIIAMMSGGRLVLKLPAARVADLLHSGIGRPFDAGKGRPLREWVALVDPDIEVTLSLGREALDFVRGSGPSAGQHRAGREGAP